MIAFIKIVITTPLNSSIQIDKVSEVKADSIKLIAMERKVSRTQIVILPVTVAIIPRT